MSDKKIKFPIKKIEYLGSKFTYINPSNLATKLKVSKSTAERLIKDYKEKYQQCNPESPSLKGAQGPKGDPGTDSTPEITDTKKQVIDMFIKNIKFENGNYYLGTQQLGCD